MMKSNAFITALAFLALLRCSNPTAGGSGTETINTFVSLPGGTPATGAVVKVIDAHGWVDSIRLKKSPVLESTTVAANGGFFLQSQPSRMVNIQIDNGATGRFLHQVRAGQLVGDTLFLDSTRFYGAAVDRPMAGDIAFRLSGTTYVSQITSPREIRMRNIAPGSYTLVAMDTAADGHPVIIKGVDLSSSVQPVQPPLELDLDRILLDDFETGVGPTTISRIFQGISWYTYSDSGAQEWDDAQRRWVAVEDGFVPQASSWMSIDSVDDGRGGKAAFFSASLDYTVDPPWAGAGFRLRRSGKEHVDLSMMQSFSLRVRGTGAVTVRLETDTYDSIGQGYSQFSAVINLTETWQTHTIPVSSLNLSMPLEATQQFVPWESASQAVNKIEFEFTGSNNTAETVQLYLDEIYLNGVTTRVFME
ncbi:MAG: hypothetical protein ACOCW2_03885 [Chitinivibrionales bacterium]